MASLSLGVLRFKGQGKGSEGLAHKTDDVFSASHFAVFLGKPDAGELLRIRYMRTSENSVKAKFREFLFPKGG